MFFEEQYLCCCVVTYKSPSLTPSLSRPLSHWIIDMQLTYYSDDNETLQYNYISLTSGCKHYLQWWWTLQTNVFNLHLSVCLSICLSATLSICLSTPWTSIPGGTSDTADWPVDCWATWRCSGCGSNESTRPTLAGSHHQAACSQDSSHQMAFDKYHNYHRLQPNAKQQLPLTL